MAAYAKRTGRDPGRYFAIGDANAILDRIAEYVDVGVQKFILRPVGVDGDAILAQTRRLIEELLPLVDARWPKTAKAAKLWSAVRPPIDGGGMKTRRKQCISARRCFSPTTR